MRIELAKAPAWIRGLEGRLGKAAERGLLAAGHRLVGVIQNEIIPAEPRMPVDRGTYRAAWKARPMGRRVVQVTNDSPHGVFIDRGVRGENVRPGRAMIEALAKWVIRKGIASGKGKTADSLRIAWAIAKSMQKNGIFEKGKGLQISKKAAARAPRLLDEEIRAEIKKEAEKGE